MKTSRKNTLSKVMKAAWKIYREDLDIKSVRVDYNAKSFSESLKAAWKWAKKNIIEKVAKIGEIIKETEKAVYAVIGGSFKYDQVLEEPVFTGTKIWIPKSIIINGGVPDWFMRKNQIHN